MLLTLFLKESIFISCGTKSVQTKRTMQGLYGAAETGITRKKKRNSEIMLKPSRHLLAQS